MEQEKLTNQKEALTYLCAKYPQCFFLDGQIKPLKIGIFQDLAIDLGDSEIVSKRLLRLSLRHYTSSWRYLSAIKAGIPRINLLGEEGEIVEAQHAEHAAQQLKESKEKAAKHRETTAKAHGKPTKHKGYTDPKPVDNAPRDGVSSAKPAQKATKQFAGKRSSNRSANRPQNINASNSPEPITIVTPSPLLANELSVGSPALVQLGKEPMPVTITDISKDGVFVQLKSGMTVKVQQAQLYSANKATNK